MPPLLDSGVADRGSGTRSIGREPEGPGDDPVPDGFDDLVAAGSVKAAREAGKARMEGKDYVMRDGDVVEFRFNV